MVEFLSDPSSGYPPRLSNVEQHRYVDCCVIIKSINKYKQYTASNMFGQKQAKTGWTASWTLSTPLNLKQTFYDLDPKFLKKINPNFIHTGSGLNTNVYLFSKRGKNKRMNDLLSKSGPSITGMAEKCDFSQILYFLWFRILHFVMSNSFKRNVFCTKGVCVHTQQ